MMARWGLLSTNVGTDVGTTPNSTCDRNAVPTRVMHRMCITADERRWYYSKLVPTLVRINCDRAGSLENTRVGIYLRSTAGRPKREKIPVV